MRLAAAARMKLREKTPAVQVINREQFSLGLIQIIFPFCKTHSPLLISMCLHLSPTQSLMTWKCAQHSPIIRTRRVWAASGTPETAAITEVRMKRRMNQPLSSILSRIFAHS